MTTPHEYNKINLGHAPGYCIHCGGTATENGLIGDPNHCPKAEAKEKAAVNAFDNGPTDDEKAAIGLYAVLARDFGDFADMIKDASQATLDTLHQMLTTPNPKHDEETLTLNSLGASMVKPLMNDTPVVSFPDTLKTGEVISVQNNGVDLGPHLMVPEKEIDELRELRDLIKGMFEEGDKDGFYIQLVRDHSKPDPQEGPHVQRMREIALPGTKAV